jgi:hypothetical protein
MKQTRYAATFYLQAGSLMGILLGGVAADRWQARSPRGRLLTQALSVAIMGPFLCLTGMAGSPGVMLAAMAVYGLC